MPLAHRRVTCRMYPTPAQAVRLEALHDLHRGLYNAALEERISAWHHGRHSISFADQCKSLTRVRAENPEYCAVNAQSLQVTLKRLHKAFDAFFRRVKLGQAPGFPRFKAKKRFSGWGYKAHGDGFRFTPGPDWKHGTLNLSGVGKVKVRGEARTPGQAVSCDIRRVDDGHWELSLVLNCEPHRERSGDLEAGLDWGVETYATLAYDLDTAVEIPNERLWQAQRDALKASQQALSNKLLGKRSKTAQRQRRQLAKQHRKLANRRKDRNHQVSARLVRGHALIVTEKLSVANMTRSARGTVEEPGRNVRQKGGLNREILDTAPADLLKQLGYKAEEAGTEFIVLDTKKAKPSQRDPLTLTARKKTLAERTHTLPDGRAIGRDHASGLVMLRLGLNGLGREPAWAATPEIASTAA